MGVWERSPAGLAIALRRRAARAGVPRRAARPARRRTSSARRTASGATSSTSGWAARPAWPRPAAELARRGAAPDPRLRAEPRRARPPGGERRTRTGSSPAPRHDLAARPAAWFDDRWRGCSPAAATRTSRRGRTSCSSTRSARELRAATVEALGAIARPVRRRPLRHGDAADQRRVRQDLGRPRGPAPAEEFWPVVIGQVREAGTRTSCCIAEAYWDMEWTLQQQGFDFCYDKRLYDRLGARGRRRRPRRISRPARTTSAG